jgi:hypothetical protein
MIILSFSLREHFHIKMQHRQKFTASGIEKDHKFKKWNQIASTFSARWASEGCHVTVTLKGIPLWHTRTMVCTWIGMALVHWTSWNKVMVTFFSTKKNSYECDLFQLNLKKAILLFYITIRLLCILALNKA